MKSYQVIAWGQPLEARTLDTPRPHGTEVLVKVEACGICHSDLHISEGSFDMGSGRRIRMEDVGAALPFTLGHEIVGVVEAVGPEARDTVVGAHVVVYPWIGCGTCRACRAGRDIECDTNRSLGTRRAGGYSDYVVVPHGRYLLDYGGLDRYVAATCACSGLTAYSALKKLPPLDRDDVLLIIGAGGLGLAALTLAPSLTGARLAVADIDDAKLEAAGRAGAHLTIDTRSLSPSAAIKARFGVAPRAIVDFVGAPETVNIALATAARGGSIVLVGLFGGSIELPTPLLTMRNLALHGSYVGTLDEMRELLEIVADHGGVPVTVRPMGEINDLLDALRAGRVVGRIVATP